MDSFNVTVLNGDLVSTRRGLHVSKSKHKGVRFVNTFTTPKSLPSSRSGRSPKTKTSNLQDYTYTFVNTPPRRTSIARRSRSPRTESPLSTPSLSLNSSTVATRETSPSYLFGDVSPASSVDPYTLEFFSSSPNSNYSDLSPPVSDRFVEDVASGRPEDLRSLLGRCQAHQVTIESMDEVVTLARSMRLMKSTSTWTTSYYSNAHTEIRQRLGIQLLQYPGPLFPETLPKGNPFANVPIDAFGQRDISNLCGDRASQMLYRQADNTNLTLSNVVDNILRTASVLYLEMLTPTYQQIRECITRLSDLAGSVILHLYEQEFVQDSYFALDNLANTDHVRPIIIWVCTVVYAFNTRSQSNMTEFNKQLNLLPFEDCLGLLVGPRAIDVDNLLEDDFALCRLLPVQELTGSLLDDRAILKMILTNYEGRRFV